MIEITKDNYKSIDFNGVIISVPREHLKDGLTLEFCFKFECAYYTKGEYGYKTPGHSPSNSSFFSVWYGDEDMPNGFGFNSTSRLPWDEKYLHFNNVRYYKFKDMTEFCTWYLERKQSKGEQSKDWIQEKCNTNKPPTEVPKEPSIGNRKKSNAIMTKAEFYHDILTYIEARLGLMQALQDVSETKDHYRRQLYLHIAEQRQQEIDKWLNEEKW